MEARAVIALTLSLPGCEETRSARGREFHVQGSIFASIPSPATLVLRLSPEQQRQVTDSDPSLFAPVNNDWGQRGWTNGKIAALDEASAFSALMMAWANVTSRPATAVSARKRG